MNCQHDGLPNFPTYSVLISDKGLAKLVQRPSLLNGWFQVEPLPFNNYRVTIKDEGSSLAKITLLNHAHDYRPNPEDCDGCNNRGWDVFDCGDGRLDIQRCDACSKFPTDYKAGQAALQYLNRHLREVK